MTLEPYHRILLGLDDAPRLLPAWFTPRGILTLFEIPDCDQATELQRRTTVTLASAQDWHFFEEGMELDDGTGHPALCGGME
ncbi:MAG TPA: hypothetical protein VGK73_31660 [Polyangiaceae bacterium]